MNRFKKIILIFLMTILLTSYMSGSFMILADDSNRDVNKQKDYIRKVYVNAMYREPTEDEISDVIERFDKKNLDAASFIFELLFPKDTTIFEMKNNEFVSLLYSILYFRELDQEGQQYIQLLDSKKTLFMGVFIQMVRSPQFFEVCDKYDVPHVQKWRYPYVLKVADLYENHVATKLVKTNLEGWTIINYLYILGLGSLIAIFILYLQYRKSIQYRK